MANRARPSSLVKGGVALLLLAAFVAVKPLTQEPQGGLRSVRLGLRSFVSFVSFGTLQLFDDDDIFAEANAAFPRDEVEEIEHLSFALQPVKEIISSLADEASNAEALQLPAFAVAIPHVADSVEHLILQGLSGRVKRDDVLISTGRALDAPPVSIGAPRLTCRFAGIFRDHMVVQRHTPIKVWGFASPGTRARVTWRAHAYSGTAGDDGVWRVTLPPSPASPRARAQGPHVNDTLRLSCDSGEAVSLTDVLVGDVLLCTGQSNMHLPVREDFGAAAELSRVQAAGRAGGAASYASIRVTTVGHCGLSSSQPHVDYAYIDQPWTPVDGAAALGGPDWAYFSSLCWHTAKDVYQALGRRVPLGLVSAAWRGTPIQAWLTPDSADQCGSQLRGLDLLPLQQEPSVSHTPLPRQRRSRGRTLPHSSRGDRPGPTASPGPDGHRCDLGASERPSSVGSVYNALIAPLTVGPMALRTVLWYQGESNTLPGHGPLYECAFPAMVSDWRRRFGREAVAPPSQARPAVLQSGGFAPHVAGDSESEVDSEGTRDDPNALGWYFVHLAPWVYAGTDDGPIGPIRAAQLAALALPRTAFATAADLGDISSPLVGGSIHPRGKLLLARRLARAVLATEYGAAALAWRGPMARRAVPYAAYSGTRRRAAQGRPATTIDVVVEFHAATCTATGGARGLRLVDPGPCPLRSAARKDPAAMGGSLEVNITAAPWVRCAGFELQAADGTWVDAAAEVLGTSEPDEGGASAEGGDRGPCALRITLISTTDASESPHAGGAAARVRYGQANWPLLSIYSGDGLPAVPFDMRVELGGDSLGG